MKKLILFPTIKEMTDEAVRDICSVSVAPASKSEVRRIVEELVYKMKEGRNVGALRQWLNERTETRLITNEDIETFLNP